MGQYYAIAFKDANGIHTNDRKVEGDGYCMAKLMEHSYFGVYIVDSVAKQLEDTDTRLAWVGDYANEIEKQDDGTEVGEVEKATNFDISHKDVWADNPKNPMVFNRVEFDYGGKYLVNHDKKVYISFDNYLKDKNPKEDWVINPIPLLTVIGNGRGGGDYEGTNMEYVGSWIWDLLSIEKEIPEGYEELPLTFKEN